MMKGSQASRAHKHGTVAKAVPDAGGLAANTAQSRRGAGRANGEH